MVLHGHVSEERKAELLARSWVNLTASSAEGWCLTVMEAALCATPSAALRVGGLPESIVDGETGLLADDGPELTAKVRVLVEDRELRERLGEAARRARRDVHLGAHRAAQTLAVLEAAAAEPRARRCATTLAASETLKAAGLAAATLASNAIALVFTVVFARMLGADGYGSLAALISAFLILAVPGSGVQVAAARETALGPARRRRAARATLARWRRRCSSRASR